MSLSVQLLHREDFESRTFRALAGAAAMGVVAGLAWRVRVPLEPGYFAVVAAAMAGARTAPRHALSLRIALALFPVLPFCFDAPGLAQVGLAGASASALVAWLGQGKDVTG